MSSKSIYGFDISGMQRMLESIYPVLKSVQMSDAITTTMSTHLISQQLFDATQPLREATERWNKIFNTAEMNALRESLMRTSELLRSSSVIEATNNIQRVLQTASLKMNLSSIVEQLNLGIDAKIFETVQRLSIDTSEIEKAIQNNLEILRGFDWSLIIDTEDFEDFNVDNSLDGAVIDFNDGVSFQEQIAELINRFKTKNPVLAILIVIFVLSPVQSAINDAMRDLVKGVTIPIVEQAQTNDYKVIEKNMKIEVNNTLIINVESKDVRDEFMKIYGYVSTDKLIMRQTNKVKSRALHTLEFGQVVRIIYKDRSWTLVEYEGDEDIIQGWVFTRYISKFKK